MSYQEFLHLLQRLVSDIRLPVQLSMIFSSLGVSEK